MPKAQDYKSVVARLMRYCAYQERSPQAVWAKLRDTELTAEEQARAYAQLQTDGFVDELRFARAYAGGKFRQQRWGRIKIRLQLQAQGLGAEAVAAGLAEIGEAPYRDTLRQLLDRKAAALAHEPAPQRIQKLFRYALGKGYEAELIGQLLAEK